MPWLISIIASLISGIAGLLLGGLISNFCVSWYSISSREGASGFFVIFWALAGGVGGVVIGLIAARVMAGQIGAGFGRELAAALVAVILIAAITLGLCRFLADVPPTLDGRPLMLEVEFRLPASSDTSKPPMTEGEWKFKLASIDGNMQWSERAGQLFPDRARQENNRWILPGEVSLFTERSKRALSLKHNETDMGGFMLSMPAHPGRDFEQWSEWLPRQQSDGSAWPSDKTSYRYRIQKVPEPPPPPTAEEFEAANIAAKEAEFAAIPDDSPLEALLKYTEYEQPQTKRALEKIAARPTIVAELRDLAHHQDAEKAHGALRCIAQLSDPPKELNSVVEAAAAKIVESITKFNNTSAEADPSFEGAVDPATRFYGWIDAARSLREKAQGDFVPELKSILELSRVRPESHCMRQDICRVASYYLKQWAGIEPLPTDPKPK
ncbi:MAG: hypothetical protein U0640_10495 [Phycisphaerales bacterium]